MLADPRQIGCAYVLVNGVSQSAALSRARAREYARSGRITLLVKSSSRPSIVVREPPRVITRRLSRRGKTPAQAIVKILSVTLAISPCRLSLRFSSVQHRDGEKHPLGGEMPARDFTRDRPIARGLFREFKRATSDIDLDIGSSHWVETTQPHGERPGSYLETRASKIASFEPTDAVGSN